MYLDRELSVVAVLNFLVEMVMEVQWLMQKMQAGKMFPYCEADKKLSSLISPSNFSKMIHFSFTFAKERVNTKICLGTIDRQVHY